MAQQDFYIKLTLSYEEALGDGLVADRAFEALDGAIEAAFPIFVELEGGDCHDEEGLPCSWIEDYVVELADSEVVGGWPVEGLEREVASLKRRLEGFEYLARALGEDASGSLLAAGG